MKFLSNLSLQKSVIFFFLIVINFININFYFINKLKLKVAKPKKIL